MLDKLKSRKLWLTIATVLVISMSELLGLDTEHIWMLIAAVGAYVAPGQLAKLRGPIKDAQSLSIKVGELEFDDAQANDVH